MRKRLLPIFIASLLAVPAAARVLSYAPYTSTPAAAGIHSRTSRWFILIEGPNEYYRQAVLYDSAGLEEPRVVYAQRVPERIGFAALYERAGDAHPLLLVGAETGPAFSNDGGATWIRIPNIGRVDLNPNGWVDHGGLWTQPLWYPVQTGNDAWPFLVQKPDGTWLIDAHGNAKKIDSSAGIIGRDREGNRFLQRRGDTIYMLSTSGSRRRVVDATMSGGYTGWITPEGQVYLELHRNEGRFLFIVRNRELFFIAGPHDVGPPVLNIARPEVEETRFFAVPTHDFRGAWMIQRESGKPTTLLRHDPSRGLETMWSDPTGREVEALIPGLSGETLLVQVHVPRDVSTAVPFVDPALAVWRVGDPAPSEYHELYLNEEANKGFLHVDVDRIEDGEPFVFTSGLLLAERGPEEGPVSPPISSGADVVQEWGVVRASFEQRLVLPGVTRTAGMHGSQWSTDVTIFNPLDVAQDVEIRYVAAGSDPSIHAARLTRTLTLAPRQLSHIPDVLNSLFLVAASGGTLTFTPEVGVSVFGRTYTRREDGGTYGYGMNAIDFFNAAGPRFELTFSGAFPGSGHRTNVMLTDTSGRGAEARLVPLRASILASSVTTAANGVSLASAQPLALYGGGLRIQPTRGTIIPAVVAIDNVTNDPTYLPPDLPAPDPRVIPMIVSDGDWRTDLHLLNASPYARVLRMEATSWDGLTTKTRNLYVDAGEDESLPDVLRTWFGMTGTARLRYVCDDEQRGEGIRVTSRLIRTLPDGGTYGTLVPALNNFQLAAPGDTLGIIGVSGGDAYRLDLALVENSPNGAATTARIRIIDDRGEELDTFEQIVRAREGVSIEDVFAKRGITAPRAARVTIEVLEGGMLGTFATLVDRRTGDPTHLPAGLQAK